MPLYLVASPIGNLADTSQRAAQVLDDADLVLAEDTRRGQQLLAHLNIKKPIWSHHDAVEQQRIPAVVERLAQGQHIALISDAGTPCVSDPGYPLVVAALQAGHQVVPIPGPSAVLTALVASGLPTHRFRFEGFVPRGKGARRAAFEALANEPATTLFFESPKRLLKSLRSLAAVLPERAVVVARELTKQYEEFLRGTASRIADELATRDRVRGGITLLVAGAPRQRPPADLPENPEVMRTLKILREEGLAPADIRRIGARLFGLSKKQVFSLMRALE